MRIDRSVRLAPTVAVLLFTSFVPVAAMNIPLQLPAPDGKVGDGSKPVKVYILVGQSIMVGMGDIKGALAQRDALGRSGHPARCNAGWPSPEQLDGLGR